VIANISGHVESSELSHLLESQRLTVFVAGAMVVRAWRAPLLNFAASTRAASTE
jgi:hypothetical protein